MPGAMLHIGYQIQVSPTKTQGMPSPVDGDATQRWPADYWWDTAKTFLDSGGTVILTPPIDKGASLGTGYDPFNHNDQGSNTYGPAGRRETRYGSVEDLMRFVSKVRAAGGQVYTNVVHHHMDGDAGDWKYDYIAGDGVTPGRFPLDINCFWVWDPKTAPVNPDRVFNAAWDLGFGREFKWDTGYYGDGKGDNGPGYVRRGLADSLQRGSERLGVEGFFLDDAKGTAVAYIVWLCNQPVMQGKFPFVELSDGETSTLQYWLSEVQQDAGVMDFALRYKIRDTCNHGADMRAIMTEGVCWVNPTRAVTFVTNIDLDLSDPIISRALLGNSMIMGFPGYAMVFGRDIDDGPHGYKLGKPIMNLLWCYSTFVKGDLVWRDSAADYLVWEMMGDSTSSGCVCCASIRQDWHEVTIQTKWKNQQLHDYTGHAEDKWTDGNGMLTFWMPPDGENGAGRGFVRYAVPGIENDTRLPPRKTVQVIQGMNDLDVPALKNGAHHITSIWPKVGTTASCTLHHQAEETDSATPPGFIILLMAPSGAPATGGVITEDGEHAVVMMGANQPDEGTPFTLTLIYEGDEA